MNHRVTSSHSLGYDAEMFNIEVSVDHTYVLDVGVVSSNSQIELRTAAFYFGDPEMLREYREGIDRHKNMALILKPDGDPKSPDFCGKGKWRSAGKTLNFLLLYLGGAETAVNTLMRDLGIEFNLHEMEEAFHRIDAYYHVLRERQQEMIATVAKQGYWELPTGWSRYWGPGDCINGKVSEIADFPCQAIAAQLLQSSLFAIACDLLAQGCRSYIIDNIYDSFGIDTYPGEEQIVEKIVEIHLTNPPLWDMLLDVLGKDRQIPLLFKKEK